MIGSTELEWRLGTIEVPINDRYIREAIELTGEYSGREMDVYAALLQPGDVALDVGANVGVFTIAMGRAVGAGGRVLAFEPQPAIAGMLARNVARHGLAHVEVRREIVAAATGDGMFADIVSLPQDRPVNFGAIGLHTRIPEEYGDMVPTAATTVDALGLERCALIKVDVEGAEAAVVRGASETIRRCRPVLSIECDRPGAALPWVDDLLAADYRLWRFRGSVVRNGNPKGAPVDHLPVVSILMLMAVPRESPLDLRAAEGPSFLPISSRAQLERLSRAVVRQSDDP